MDKILEGKMKKFYSETTLLNQTYILDQEKKLKEQEELRREQKFKEREFRKKEIYNNEDLEVSTSTLESFKIDKTSQN